MGLERPKDIQKKEIPKQNPIQCKMSVIYTITEKPVEEVKDKSVFDTKQSYFFSPSFLA